MGQQIVTHYDDKNDVNGDVDINEDVSALHSILISGL